MKLKTIKEEELETMPFDDLAYAILKEKGKKMKTGDIFKTICELLNLSEKAYEEQIAEFFTLLATEKRFLQLDKGYWDLRENHTAKIELEEELEEAEEELEEITEPEEELEEEDIFIDETKDIDDDETDDEYKDLVVMDEETEIDL